MSSNSVTEIVVENNTALFVQLLVKTVYTLTKKRTMTPIGTELGDIDQHDLHRLGRLLYPVRPCH